MAYSFSAENENVPKIKYHFRPETETKPKIWDHFRPKTKLVGLLKTKTSRLFDVRLSDTDYTKTLIWCQSSH